MDEEDHWPLHDTRLKKRKASIILGTAIVLGVLLAAALVAIVGLSVALRQEQSKNNALSHKTTAAPQSHHNGLKQSSKLNPEPAGPTSSIVPIPGPTSNIVPTPSSTHSPTLSPSPSPVVPTPATPRTCLSRECVELGSQILSSLDESFHPCDNFYKFVCNRYLKQTILPYGEAFTGPLESLMGRNEERFRVLMESGNNRSVGAVQKAIDYYQSCMDRERVEAESLPALTSILTELGGWPLVGINVPSPAPWNINDPQGFLKERLFGNDAFLTVTVLPNPFNSSENILTVDQGGLTLPSKDTYTDPVALSQISSLILSVLEAINSSIPEDDYHTAVADILEFEATIANFTDFGATGKSFADRANLSTLAELRGYFPSINWTQSLLYYADLGEFSVNLSAPVNLLAPVKFLAEMDALIAYTSPTTLQNYAKWHLMYKLLPVLSREFSGIVTGVEEPPRYKMCVNNIQGQIPQALARAYTEEYFTSEHNESMLVVLNELKMALMETIDAKDWLDNSTKQHALKKAQRINEFLAYPKEIENTTYLDNFYSKLTISASESYFVNYLHATSFNMLLSIAALGHTNNRSSWDLGLPFPPTVVNAAYFPLENQIFILEGILNFPFFKSYWPDYFKFGSIGFVVGHEFVHGFDNTGRRFDEVGNLANWWSSSSTTEFNNRAKCFINQYDQYSLPAGPVNGTLTLGENIADNGGIGIAYKAYKNRVKKTGEAEMLLPALNYTTNQLFFIASALPWCQIVSPSGQEQLLADEHTPNSLRSLGMLSNSQEFAAAFQCPKDSVMNPEHKCAIW